MGVADAKPKLADLSRELIWSETVNFGVQLGMEFPVLKEIGEDKTDDVRFLTAMDAWLRSDGKASWKKVVRALRAIRKEVLAQELEMKYCRDGGRERCVSVEDTVAQEGSGSAAIATHNLPNNPPAPPGV